MKTVSLILIVLYLVLPTACLAHPCSSLGELAHQEAAVDVISGLSDECPLNHDTDDCESTCCCAVHVLTPLSRDLFSANPKTNNPPYEPNLALPRLIDRIFVPPQNIS